MSTVYVHVGQCGNQIGKSLWAKYQTLINENSNIKHCFWTHGTLGKDQNGHVRAVFIDGEKKVLQHLPGKKKKSVNLEIGYGNIISGKRGCGSNWAVGFNQLPKDAVANEWPTNTYSYQSELDYGNEHSVLKATMETIRKEVEACSSFSGFVIIHSLGGGTGSGLGSRVTEELKLRYAAAFQFNIVVAPHNTGESPLQQYNEILTLGRLQDVSDAVLIFENDIVLQNILTSMPQKHGSMKKVTFEDMNNYVANCISRLLSPVSTLTPRKGKSIGIEPWELIRSVAPMPRLKLLSCSTEQIVLTNDSNPPWNKLCNRLCLQSHSRLQSGDGIIGATISLAGICRGCTTTNSPNISTLADKLKKGYNTVSWNPYPVDIWQDYIRSKSLPTTECSLTVCANSSILATEHCNKVVRSAKKKLNANAYVHWYERSGTTRNDISDALDSIESVVAEYKEFVK